MQFFTRFLALALMFSLMLASHLQGQDKDASKMMVVHEDVVKPNMTAKYEEASKHMVAQLKAHNAQDMSYNTARTDNGSYLHISPIESLSDLEKDPMSGLAEAMGAEAMKAMWDNFNGCYDVHKTYLVSLEPSLSYMPDSDDAPNSELTFRHWDEFKVVPGSEAAIEALFKAHAKVMADNNVDWGYRVYKGGLGMEEGTYVMVRSAKDLSDYTARRSALMETHGEALAPLRKQFMELLREFDHYNGSMRPDLSYSPASE